MTKKFFKSKVAVWMSHEDAVVKLTKKFKSLLLQKTLNLTIIENKKENIYGVQFHPEVTHTDNGKKIFKNFLFSICKVKKRWNVLFSKK